MERKELHLITTGQHSLTDVLSILMQLTNDSVVALDALHIREKQRSASELVEWVNRIREILPSIPIYMNDRVDVALAVATSGVQLAWHSLPPILARQLIPSSMRLGCSVHSVAEAQLCAQAGADFLLFGHVFPTSSKAGQPARGCHALSEVVSAVSLPVIALGGITHLRIAELLPSGCAGVAIMSGVFAAVDANQEIIALRTALDLHTDTI